MAQQLDQTNQPLPESSSWYISADEIGTDFETNTVLQGSKVYWTDNKSRSIVVTRNPVTGIEDRYELRAPEPWWVIQKMMQSMAAVFHGMPIMAPSGNLEPVEGQDQP